MDFIQQLLLAIVVFLGGFAGIILAVVAREELHYGKKYFKQLKAVVVLAMVFITFLLLGKVTLSILLTLLLAAFFYFYRHRIIEYIQYALVAILFAVGVHNDILVVPLSILAFFYGFPKAGLFTLRFPKSKWPSLMAGYVRRNYYFLIITLGIVVIRQLVV